MISEQTYREWCIMLPEYYRIYLRTKKKKPEFAKNWQKPALADIERKIKEFEDALRVGTTEEDTQHLEQPQELETEIRRIRGRS